MYYKIIEYLGILSWCQKYGARRIASVIDWKGELRAKRLFYYVRRADLESVKAVIRIGGDPNTYKLRPQFLSLPVNLIEYALLLMSYDHNIGEDPLWHSCANDESDNPGLEYNKRLSSIINLLSQSSYQVRNRSFLLKRFMFCCKKMRALKGGASIDHETIDHEILDNLQRVGCEEEDEDTAFLGSKPEFANKLLNFLTLKREHFAAMFWMNYTPISYFNPEPSESLVRHPRLKSLYRDKKKGIKPMNVDALDKVFKSYDPFAL